jgi:hypothetical protein
MGGGPATDVLAGLPMLDGWVRDGALSSDDAERAARMVAAGNARGVYSRLP